MWKGQTSHHLACFSPQKVHIFKYLRVFHICDDDLTCSIIFFSLLHFLCKEMHYSSAKLPAFESRISLKCRPTGASSGWTNNHITWWMDDASGSSSGCSEANLRGWKTSLQFSWLLQPQADTHRKIHFQRPTCSWACSKWNSLNNAGFRTFDHSPFSLLALMTSSGMSLRTFAPNQLSFHSLAEAHPRGYWSTSRTSRSTQVSCCC